MLSLKGSGRRVRCVAAKGLLFFSLTVGLQWFAGAYSSEFGLEPDEASHYLTGLMVRDYIASGFPSPPLRYAENYYIHYPRVAFGHYPPMFYMVQAPWMLIFGVSRVCMMLLMTALTTMLALLVEAVISKKHGTVVGIALACLILVMPETQRAASTVMAESLLAAAAFAALIYYARYLESGGWRDATGFTVFAGMAILTKGLALALAAVPLFAVVISRRWELCRKFSFWLPAVVVGAVCAPIYEFLPATGIKTFSKSQGFYMAPWASGTLIPYELRQLGIIAVACIGLGVFLWLRNAISRRPVEVIETVAGAGLLGFLVLRMFVRSASEPRHAMMIAAPLMIFLAAGAGWVARRLRESGAMPFASTGLVLVPAIAVFLWTAFEVPHKPYYGLDRVASDLTSGKSTGGDVILIASFGWEEGAFISEVAMREQRPKHYILRGYKVLVHRYRREHKIAYAMNFATQEELARYLDSVPVGVVVLSFPQGGQVEPQEFQVLLEKTVDSRPDIWAKREYAGGMARNAGERILVYSRLVPIECSHPRIQIDMKSRLGKMLEN